MSVEIPSLDPKNTDFGALPKDPLDSFSQQLNFLGSNGFKYTRYLKNSRKNGIEWFNYLRSPNSLKI